MASISFKRQLQTILSTYNATIVSGVVKETAGKFYLPFSFDTFSAPDITVEGVTVTSGATKLVGPDGAFDDIRVGDEVGAPSTGSLTAKSDITVDECFTFNGLPFVMYPSTVNLATAGVKAGDAVAGGGIPVSTKVDKIDYDNRTIYLTNACTESAIQSGEDILTFTPPIRVTAVRTSEATSNANEVDIDTTVATTGAAADVDFTPGANEAVAMVLRVEPLSNSTGGRLNATVGVAYIDGTLIRGSATGYSNLDFTALNYITLGTMGIDGDDFLVKARVPRPTS